MLSVKIIQIIHLIIIILLIISIVVPNCTYKKYVLIILIFLLIQYLFTCGKCGLTQLEYMVLGQDKYQEGFIYRIVKPIITVQEKYFQYGIFILHIVWICILWIQLNNQKCI